MSTLSVDQITTTMLNQLKALDPAISAEEGTPERKIIEATAEIISASQVDLSVLDSQHDVNSMTGGRLDQFTSIFGFSRQQPTAATGVVTFSRSTPATVDIVIPLGTQVQATASDPTFPSVTFSTTQTVTLPIGSDTADAPVQAALPGTIGNVGANAVTGFAGLKTITGIETVSNAAAMSGGVDSETDDDFRVRFVNSLFRNMAGTYDQYLALAVSQPGVSKAVVLGPVSRYQEYVLVPASDDAVARTDSHDGHTSDDKNYDPGTGGATDNSTGTNFAHKRTTAPSSIPYSKYTYTTGYFLTDGGLNTTATFFRPDVDYVFNRKAIDPAASTNYVRHFNATAVANHQPNITVLGYGASIFPAGLTPGTVVLLEHQYISANSRNDLGKGITNAVDVFVNGSNPTTVKSTEVIPGDGHRLQRHNQNTWTYQNPNGLDNTGTPNGDLVDYPAVTNFVRKLDGSTSRTESSSGAGDGSGNRIIPTFWQPFLNGPDSFRITVSSVTYVLYRANYTNGSESYHDAAMTKIANYFEVQEINNLQGTVRCRNGIELRCNKNIYLASDDSDSGVSGGDSSLIGAEITSFNYNYDANIAAIQAIMDNNKQVTADVLVHAAHNRYFGLYISLIYSPGSTPSVVNTAISAALAGYFENQYFGAVIQLSDLLNVIANTPGVDNVRWTHDTDGSTHKVQELNADGSQLGTPTYFDVDFYLQDNELAALPSANGVTIVVRTQNVWGT